MTEFGVMAPLWAKPSDIIGPGAPWLRIVLRPHEDASAFIDAAHAVGGKVLGVLARESFPMFTSRPSQMAKYKTRYRGRLDAIEVGNEPDQKSPSSWTLTPRAFSTLLGQARTVWPNTMLVCGGLVSGNPDYLKGVDLGPVDSIALHPYGRGTDSHPYPGGGFGTVGGLIDLYRGYGKGIVVSEFGGPASDFDSESERSAYLGAVMQGLAAEDLAFAIHFCWSDSMVDGFGLVDAHQVPKESYASFYAAADALQNFSPEEEEEEEEESDDWTAPMFAWAEQQYGLTPYAFGGDRTEDGSGPWDCAGFVMRMFHEIGIDIDPDHTDPYTNAERLRLACDPVDSPGVGDLVFFAATYPTPGASHVGVVKDSAASVMVDDHQRSATSGPDETDYSTPYWQAHLMGFGRVRR